MSENNNIINTVRQATKTVFFAKCSNITEVQTSLKNMFNDQVGTFISRSGDNLVILKNTTETIASGNTNFEILHGMNQIPPNTFINTVDTAALTTGVMAAIRTSFSSKFGDVVKNANAPNVLQPGSVTPIRHIFGVDGIRTGNKRWSTIVSVVSSRVNGGYFDTMMTIADDRGNNVRSFDKTVYYSRKGPVSLPVHRSHTGLSPFMYCSGDIGSSDSSMLLQTTGIDGIIEEGKYIVVAFYGYNNKPLADFGAESVKIQPSVLVMDGSGENLQLHTVACELPKNIMGRTSMIPFLVMRTGEPIYADDGTIVGQNYDLFAPSGVPTGVSEVSTGTMNEQVEDSIRDLCNQAKNAFDILEPIEQKVLPVTAQPSVFGSVLPIRFPEEILEVEFTDSDSQQELSPLVCVMETSDIRMPEVYSGCISVCLGHGTGITSPFVNTTGTITLGITPASSDVSDVAKNTGNSLIVFFTSDKSKTYPAVYTQALEKLSGIFIHKISTVIPTGLDRDMFIRKLKILPFMIASQFSICIVEDNIGTRILYRSAPSTAFSRLLPPNTNAHTNVTDILSDNRILEWVYDKSIFRIATPQRISNKEELRVLLPNGELVAQSDNRNTIQPSVDDGDGNVSFDSVLFHDLMAQYAVIMDATRLNKIVSTIVDQIEQRRVAVMKEESKLAQEKSHGFTRFFMAGLSSGDLVVGTPEYESVLENLRKNRNAIRSRMGVVKADFNKEVEPILKILFSTSSLLGTYSSTQAASKSVKQAKRKMDIDNNIKNAAEINGADYADSLGDINFTIANVNSELLQQLLLYVDTIDKMAGFPAPSQFDSMISMPARSNCFDSITMSAILGVTEGDSEVPAHEKYSKHPLANSNDCVGTGSFGMPQIDDRLSSSIIVPILDELRSIKDPSKTIWTDLCNIPVVSTYRIKSRSMLTSSRIANHISRTSGKAFPSATCLGMGHILIEILLNIAADAIHVGMGDRVPELTNGEKQTSSTALCDAAAFDNTPVQSVRGILGHILCTAASTLATLSPFYKFMYNQHVSLPRLSSRDLSYLMRFIPMMKYACWDDTNAIANVKRYIAMSTIRIARPVISQMEKMSSQFDKAVSDSHDLVKQKELQFLVVAVQYIFNLFDNVKETLLTTREFPNTERTMASGEKLNTRWAKYHMSINCNHCFSKTTKRIRHFIYTLSQGEMTFDHFEDTLKYCIPLHFRRSGMFRDLKRIFIGSCVNLQGVSKTQNDDENKANFINIKQQARNFIDNFNDVFEWGDMYAENTKWRPQNMKNLRHMFQVVGDAELYRNPYSIRELPFLSSFDIEKAVRELTGDIDIISEDCTPADVLSVSTVSRSLAISTMDTLTKQLPDGSESIITDLVHSFYDTQDSPMNHFVKSLCVSTTDGTLDNVHQICNITGIEFESLNSFVSANLPLVLTGWRDYEGTMSKLIKRLQSDYDRRS